MPLSCRSAKLRTWPRLTLPFQPRVFLRCSTIEVPTKRGPLLFCRCRTAALGGNIFLPLSGVFPAVSECQPGSSWQFSFQTLEAPLRGLCCCDQAAFARRGNPWLTADRASVPINSSTCGQTAGRAAARSWWSGHPGQIFSPRLQSHE
jgi:hypothetical protein